MHHPGGRLLGAVGSVRSSVLFCWRPLTHTPAPAGGRRKKGGCVWPGFSFLLEHPGPEPVTELLPASSLTCLPPGPQRVKMKAPQRQFWATLLTAPLSQEVDSGHHPMTPAGWFLLHPARSQLESPPRPPGSLFLLLSLFPSSRRRLVTGAKG